MTIEQMLHEADPLRQSGFRTPAPAIVRSVGRELALSSMGSADVPSAARSPRRRRVVVAGLVASAVLGVSTTSFAVRDTPGEAGDHVFSYLRNDSDVHVDLDSVERVATGPGPAGARFSVMRVSDPENGTICLSPGFETAASAAAALPTDFRRNGVFCIPKENRRHRRGPFGQGGAVAENQADRYRTYLYQAGAAVRAEIRLPDGTTTPALLVDGQVCGWFPSTATSPTLVGYDKNGAVTDEMPIQPPAPPRPTG